MSEREAEAIELLGLLEAEVTAWRGKAVERYGMLAVPPGDPLQRARAFLASPVDVGAPDPKAIYSFGPTPVSPEFQAVIEDAIAESEAADGLGAPDPTSEDQ